LKKALKSATKVKSLGVKKNHPASGEKTDNLESAPHPSGKIFLGTLDTELQLQFMVESLGVMGITPEDVLSEKATSAAQRFIAALSGIDPQDEIQGMLGVQLFASHCMCMEFSRRAMHPEQRGEGVDANLDRVVRFMKIFLEQVACLQKLRGKAAQQKVVVEHVHVHQGGQAVVGAVTPRGEGEG
jgi:hypothetical protein